SLRVIEPSSALLWPLLRREKAFQGATGILFHLPIELRVQQEKAGHPHLYEISENVNRNNIYLLVRRLVADFERKFGSANSSHRRGKINPPAPSDRRLEKTVCRDHHYHQTRIQKPQ